MNKRPPQASRSWQVNEPVFTVDDVAATGEHTSFEAFFLAHHQRLYRALGLITTRTQEAEELAQEAFVRVWERWPHVARMDSPEGYLYRTAMNLLRSRLRRATVAARRLIPRPATPDPFEAVEARDELARGLARIPPRQRAAVVLVEYLQMDSDAAARALGIAPSTVRVLAMKGRAALRSTMERSDE
ncbi:MAG: RNA polymerase sigma factor [Actinobacteria bacterium]|nr:RNA polymerase sigma factor [Actinomycetota bacterium]